MSMSHTPGPWRVASAGLHQIHIVTIDPKEDEPNGLVALIERVAWCNDGEQSANARLIAAAPDLVESSVGLLDWLEQMFPDEPLFHGDPGTQQSFRIKEIRAAIAKATGKEAA